LVNHSSRVAGPSPNCVKWEAGGSLDFTRECRLPTLTALSDRVSGRGCVGCSQFSPMPEPNPYQSPSTPETNESPVGWPADSPPWGRLGIIWDICFLFGFVWFIGSALMYAALLTISAALENEFPKPHSNVPQPYYDLAGYASFISCSVLALIVGVVLVVKRRAEFRHNWPDWRTSLEYVIWSTIIMAPAWAVYIWIAESYRFRLPVDGNWVAISAGSLLGIIHGYVCKRGWHYHRPADAPESAAKIPNTCGTGVRNRFSDDHLQNGSCHLFGPPGGRPPWEAPEGR
jgi:hypothetical protein